jgi:hypothetical protein
MLDNGTRGIEARADPLAGAAGWCLDHRAIDDPYHLTSA